MCASIYLALGSNGLVGLAQGRQPAVVHLGRRRTTSITRQPLGHCGRCGDGAALARAVLELVRVGVLCVNKEGVCCHILDVCVCVVSRVAGCLSFSPSWLAVDHMYHSPYFLCRDL